MGEGQSPFFFDNPDRELISHQDEFLIFEKYPDLNLILLIFPIETIVQNTMNYGVGTNRIAFRRYFAVFPSLKVTALASTEPLLELLRSCCKANICGF